jgi:hypothetical protein
MKQAIAAGALLLAVVQPLWAQVVVPEGRSSEPLVVEPAPGQTVAPAPVAPDPTIGRRSRDANEMLPSAPNAQSGGRPNNPNPGPTDSSGNVPSENR